jgi:chromosome condensin MukBEF MukE localization factor
MEIEIAEQLKIKLENEIRTKIKIYEELTGLVVDAVELMRVSNMGGGSDLIDTKLRVEMK